MKSKPIRLTATSHALLALLDQLGEATPYEIKQALEKSIENFWPVPHTTAYEEPARLAAAGYLSVRQEEGGRRRKAYSLTDEGRSALATWAADPAVLPPQLRDEAVLKVFAGADPGPLLEVREAWHREKLTELQGYLDEVSGEEDWQRSQRVLTVGVAYHRKMLEMLEEVRGSLTGLRGVLDKAARLHARNMAIRGFFDHEDPQGRGPLERVEIFDTRHEFFFVGENIAAGYPSVAVACQGWMHSSGHRENILNGDYTRIGGGFARGGPYGRYYVQVFAKGGGPDAAELTGDQKVTYSLGMDEAFKALADPTRRSLLDELFERDGQTLSALEGRLPMTRFGVMKHLRVLEEAGLVTTRKRGREKLHFLNPVPIRLVHDRWVSKYAEPWAAALTGLKHELEERTMEKVFEIYIKTTPERLWEAITDDAMRQKYNFGVGVRSSWAPGSGYEGFHPGAGIAIAAGENLEVDPPNRLVQSFTALWSDQVKSEGTSRVTWEIEQVEDSCRLTVIHDQLNEGANDELFGGWPMILSGLKTLLETGEDLTTPGSLRYSQA